MGNGKKILAMEKLNEELQPDAENFLGKGTIVVSQIEVKGPSQCSVPDQGRSLTMVDSRGGARGSKQRGSV